MVRRPEREVQFKRSERMQATIAVDDMLTARPTTSPASQRCPLAVQGDQRRRARSPATPGHRRTRIRGLHGAQAGRLNSAVEHQEDDPEFQAWDSSDSASTLKPVRPEGDADDGSTQSSDGSRKRRVQKTRRSWSQQQQNRQDVISCISGRVRSEQDSACPITMSSQARFVAAGGFRKVYRSIAAGSGHRTCAKD